MSTMTSTGGTAPAGAAAAEAGRRGGPRLSGMNWLVWRQHRAAYWTLVAAAAVTVAVMIYQRRQMMTYLDDYGSINGLKAGWEEKFDFQQPLSMASRLIGLAPVLIGVFVGAPLLAADLENGTAKLVTTQSAGRARWLGTKLGTTTLMVVVCTGAVSAAFTWWWSPVKSSSYALDWSGGAFDSSGPVPVALTLLSVVGGVAIGMLLRRTLLSMVVTLGFAVAVQMAWSYFRMSLGNIVTVKTAKGVGDGTFPAVPDGAHVVDQSYLTASGDFVGTGSCTEATAKATAACLDKTHVVGWAVEYIPISQMSTMQWLGASILLALTAGIAAFVILWGRKRLV
ncbi:ABC transporter [Streptomyces sp. S3(2020)]|uniref:ABC transporter n=1 Tax=Streptomyces sp. S3(2020) TaxID=2732044 RepID=UPI001488329C|nr:ABC transporter [Streptomyces sp. S3(2020)]NNN29630.1 ABC transporter [Streptomyces sp. S3(2020)]